MVIALVWAALRRRPFSVICTLVLGLLWASLLGVSAPAAVLVWAFASLLLLEVWLVGEPFILERLGCRILSSPELERLGVTLSRFRIAALAHDDPGAWVVGGLRTVVISRGALEMLSDRALQGMIGHVAIQQREPILLRECVVWLGTAPLLLGWWGSRWLAQLGCLMAMAIGWILFLPMLLWPQRFVRYVGAALGAVLVSLIGAMLISAGAPALGLSLWLGWGILFGMRKLLAWEACHAEVEADRAAVSAGLGWHLLDALDSVAQTDRAQPCGVLRFLARPGTPPEQRTRHVLAALRGSAAPH